MKIAILGYSYIVKKAVIPALRKSGWDIVGCASKSNEKDIPQDINSFLTYEQALQSDADVIYISLHNSAHKEWIIKSLEAGKHVIVDKPAVLSLKEAKECVNAANGKLIFEAIAYKYHTQHRTLRAKIGRHKHPLQKITAAFGFPPLPKENFRNRPDLGGGCLYDIGPYMIAVGQQYFGKRATSITATAHKDKKVPTSGSVLITYGENEILTGHFGFNLEYQNKIELWGQGFHYSLNRVFTIPPDMENTIEKKAGDKVETILVDSCDQFEHMCKEVQNIIEKKLIATNIKQFLTHTAQMQALLDSVKKNKTIEVNYS